MKVFLGLKKFMTCSGNAKIAGVCRMKVRAEPGLLEAQCVYCFMLDNEILKVVKGDGF